MQRSLSDWEGYREPCSASDTFAFGFDRSTVDFDTVIGDRKSEAKPAISARGWTIGLPVLFEYMR